MSVRRSTGVLLIASGSIGIFAGFMLSITLAGAICGVPMIIISAIMVIWGYLMKAKDQGIKDDRLTERMLLTQAVASGVNICPRCKTPNARQSHSCSGCGFELVPIGDPAPVSAIDPADAALKTKQVNDPALPVFEPEEW